MPPYKPKSGYDSWISSQDGQDYRVSRYEVGDEEPVLPKNFTLKDLKICFDNIQDHFISVQEDTRRLEKSVDKLRSDKEAASKSEVAHLKGMVKVMETEIEVLKRHDRSMHDSFRTLCEGVNNMAKELDALKARMDTDLNAHMNPNRGVLLEPKGVDHAP